MFAAQSNFWARLAHQRNLFKLCRGIRIPELVLCRNVCHFCTRITVSAQRIRHLGLRHQSREKSVAAAMPV
jgi:hypothetical protein